MDPVDVDVIERGLLWSLVARVLVPDKVADPRIDNEAREAIIRMAAGERTDRFVALGLLYGVRADLIGGIHSDRSDAAAQLIPEGRDAVCIVSADPDAPPTTIVFRAQAYPESLDRALREALIESMGHRDEEAIEKAKLRSSVDDACASECACCALGQLVPGAGVVHCAACIACAATDHVPLPAF